MIYLLIIAKILYDLQSSKKSKIFTVSYTDAVSRTAPCNEPNYYAGETIVTKQIIHNIHKSVILHGNNYTLCYIYSMYLIYLYINFINILYNYYYICAFTMNNNMNNNIGYQHFEVILTPPTTEKDQGSYI